jgi:hypothetical protein
MARTAPRDARQVRRRRDRWSGHRSNHHRWTDGPRPRDLVGSRARLDGVAKQVVERAREIVTITDHRRITFAAKGNVARGGDALEQAYSFVQERAERQGSAFPLGLARDDQERLHHSIQPADLLETRPHVRLHVRRHILRSVQDVQLQLDAGEGISNLVRYSGHDAAQSREALTVR